MLFDANNKAIDKPVLMHSSVRAFVIHFLESIIAEVAMCKSSSFSLVSVS